jgi:hypothetical protein
MESEDLAEYQLSAAVVALGEPERVFAQTRSLVKAIRRLALGTGLVFVAAAVGLVPFFRMIGPPELTQGGVGLVVIFVSVALLAIFGAILTVFGVRSIASSPVYALYSKAFAYLEQGTWTIVAWDQVSEFCEPGLKSMYAQLLLRDGRQITLRNDFFYPDMFYDEVKRRVTNPKLAPARPTAGPAATITAVPVASAP